MKLQGCTLADTWLHNLTGIGYNIMSIPPIRRNHDVHGFWSVSDAVYDIYDVSMALEFNNISIFQILLLKSNIQFFKFLCVKTTFRFFPPGLLRNVLVARHGAVAPWLLPRYDPYTTIVAKTFRVRVSGTGSFTPVKGDRNPTSSWRLWASKASCARQST